MGIIELLQTELKKLFSSKTIIFTLIGLLLIPIVYAAILLSSKWGPYDYKDNLPVAVVNNDKGAVSDGEEINVGNELVNTLKEGDGLGWEFVSKEEAKKGLDSNKYYMVIEIPEDFSQKVTTVLDENPQIPEIRFTRNEGMNFLASQVTNSAVEKVREQLGDKITATFATKVFNRFPEIAEGFLSGADGAKQIKDGTVQLAEGTETMLSSLQQKAPDINRLAAGAKQADAGAGTLLSSVQNGTGDINKLAAGSGQVANGATQLQKEGTQAVLNGLKTELAPGTKQILDGLNKVAPGTEELVKGYTTQMLPGAQSIYGGIKKIDDNLDDLDSGAQQVAGGVASLKDSLLGFGAKDTPQNKGIKGNVKDIQNGAETIETNLNTAKNLLYKYMTTPDAAKDPTDLQTAYAILAGTPSQPGGVIAGVTLIKNGAAQIVQGIEDKETDINTLVAGSSGISNGISQIKAGFRGTTPETAPGLKAGAEALALGMAQNKPKIEELAGGAAQLQAGQQKVVTGVNTLIAGQTKVNESAKTLAAGASQVADGNKKLTNSWSTLTSGIRQLKDGTSQIADGNQTVATGWNTLIDGTTRLSDGAGKLREGSDQLATGLEGGHEQVSAVSFTEDNINMFASPVKLTGNDVNGYEYYRDSTAPYILSLALFVTLLISSFFIDFKKPATTPSSAISWYLSKWLTLALFAIVQALVVSLFVLVALKLSVTNVGLFILFAMFVSLTFMSIIFFFVAIGQNIGRFLALAFIVLQLSITGANLPIPMLPSNLQALGKFLPLTYSNTGFNAVINLGDTSLLGQNALILLVFLIVTSLLALAIFLVNFKSVTPQAHAQADV